MEDVEFEKLLEDRRHEELKNALIDISTILENKNDMGIIDAIEKQVSAFLSAIKKLPAPEVNVEVNQKEISTSVAKMSAEIVKSLIDLKQEIEVLNSPKEWEFRVRRDDSTHSITSVIAKQLK